MRSGGTDCDDGEVSSMVDESGDVAGVELVEAAAAVAAVIDSEVLDGGAVGNRCINRDGDDGVVVLVVVEVVELELELDVDETLVLDAWRSSSGDETVTTGADVPPLELEA